MITKLALAIPVIALALAGCTASEGANVSSPATESQSSSAIELPKPVPAGQSADWVRPDYRDGTPGTTWSIKLDGVTCGLTSIPNSKSNPAWDGSAASGPHYLAATPAPGQEFCRGDWTMTNAGAAPDSPPDIGDLVVGGKQFAPASAADGPDVHVVMRETLGVEYAASVNPGRSVKTLQIWEVPVGSKPEGAWVPPASWSEDAVGVMFGVNGVRLSGHVLTP